MSQTPRWAVGMEKLGPGIYCTADRELHISGSEICEHYGMPYTPENVAIIASAVVEIFGGLPILYRDDEP